MGASFDPKDRRGARTNLVRLPLSATDFSTRGWTWQDDPDLLPAPTAETEQAIDMLHEAKKRQPRLGVVGSAWSAPGWMKDSGRLQGDALAAGHEHDYAELLVGTNFRAGVAHGELFSVRGSPPTLSRQEDG